MKEHSLGAMISHIIMKYSVAKRSISARSNIQHLIPFRWMDGSFLELDAESIEAEVDEYWRELYKIQKVSMSQVS